MKSGKNDIILVMAFLASMLIPSLSFADWRAEADARIRRHRRGTGIVRVLDAAGNPVEGAKITVDQKSHEFWFGTALATQMFREKTPADQREKYLAIVRDDFNSAVHENALKWMPTERERGRVDFADADRILEWCEENGIRMRGHCIFWDVEKYVQDWIKALSPGEMFQEIQRRAREVPSRYRGRILEYDANNEMIHGRFYAQRLNGGTIYHRMFQWAHEADPNAVLYVNDFDILNGNALEAYKQQIRSFLDAGVPLGGIGCQGHFGGRIPPPERIWESLDSLAEFGLPIKITEYDCETEDEAYKAEALEDFYRLCFSHPGVDGILMWGFWEGAHWKKKAAIFDRDFQPRPAALAYRNLITKEWHTDLTGATKADGTFTFKGYFGDYGITVTMPDGTSKQYDFELLSSTPTATTLTVKLEKDEKPMNNVILIAIDTLRADRLSCYGHTRLTSPHLDRVAAHGVLFEECFSPHIPTHPGFTTMFTGVDVMKHQILCQGGKVDLDSAIPTLPEILQQAGYFTAAADNLGRWFNRGYERYQGYKWEQNVQGDGFRKAEAVNAVALDLLEECASQSKPFFLYLHYWDPHTPYLPPPPFPRMFYAGNESDPDNKSMEPLFACPAFGDYFRGWMGQVTDIKFPCAQYDSEIAYVDTVLASLFTRIQQLSLWEDTLLIFVSDHGEELDEHDMWFDHHGLYDTNLHVPLIYHCPSRIPSGKRVKGIVRLTDLAPTILDFLGLGELSGDAGMEGKSMLSLMEFRSRSRRGTCNELFLTECSWMKKRGFRNTEWKLITALEQDYHGKPMIELYHLPTDPGEQHNLADQKPEVVADLKRRIDEWLARRLAETGLPDPMSYQDITLRKVGSLAVAVPDNQKLVD